MEFPCTRVGCEWGTVWLKRSSGYGRISDTDVVIPVPDTSRTAAIQVATILAQNFARGSSRTPYGGPSLPGQAVRKKSVRQKLNAISLEFKDKHVLLVDDSIVRGTTCSEIIRWRVTPGANGLLRRPLHRFAIQRSGIDMPAADELNVYGRSVEEIQDAMGLIGWICQTWTHSFRQPVTVIQRLPTMKILSFPVGTSLVM